VTDVLNYRRVWVRVALLLLVIRGLIRRRLILIMRWVVRGISTLRGIVRRHSTLRGIVRRHCSSLRIRGCSVRISVTRRRDHSSFEASLKLDWY
jgi:hypothetical protein